MSRTHLLLFSLLFFMSSWASGQLPGEPIGMYSKGFLLKKDVYVKCDIEMTHEQLLKVFLKDPQMDKYTRPLAINYMFGKVLSSTASVLIALPLVESISDNGSPNWNLAYIGGACLAASIPFKLAFKTKARRAVAFYNSGYREKDELSLQLQPGVNSLGLRLSF
ncbi:hypothetical protein [Mangrovibacterium marinum]|uniref:Uncharacterized protein n=1 Tax=Mangrovibacterium marinum TaxID=1639118 RepID=A0A2T5C2T9_9BACT|nr:hypothetical protein [Mangrovibacterium marinum]PTN09019.1 hypothetical protein C8N47_106118 [Mangrovibacterium marinum]